MIPPSWFFADNMLNYKNMNDIYVSEMMGVIFFALMTLLLTIKASRKNGGSMLK